jgi:hypothetical protein
MARRVRSIELYKRLVIAFEEQPGNFSYAAKWAGCVRPTAKGAWEKGWPEFSWGRPIRAVIEERQALIRGRMREMESEARWKAATLHASGAEHMERVLEASEAEMQRARERAEIETKQRIAHLKAEAQFDSVEARANTLECVRYSKRNAQLLLGYSLRILRDADPLIKQLGADLPMLRTPQARLAAAMQIVRFAHEANENAKLALEIERRELGEPDIVVETREHTPQEMAAKVRALSASLERQGLKVLPGGATGANGTNGKANGHG